LISDPMSGVRLAGARRRVKWAAVLPLRRGSGFFVT
jgi:hypothetical protein